MGGGALRAALVTALAVGGGLVASAPGAMAATGAGQPIAVAVAPDGTSYLGFVDSTALLVVAPNGGVLGSLPVPGVGLVTALAVDPDGDVWVDDGVSVTRMRPDGTRVSRFDHTPPASCSADAAHDPSRRGGIAVTGDRVYVADRCSATMGVYTRAGVLKDTVYLPGSGLPRGIAWAPAYKKVPARVYVAIPGDGAVYGFDAAGLRAGSRPVVEVRLPKPTGYAVPVSGGIAGDDRGHLAVLDVVNNALLVYDATSRYRLSSTLGHPPAASAERGRLSAPASLAQGGAAVGRDYWIADTANTRVQRWTPGGTTRWMTDAVTGAVVGGVDPGPAPTGPVDTCRGAPSVSIDDGRKYATDPYVELKIRAPEGATEVEISHDGFAHVDRKPLTEDCRYEWTLPSGASARPRAVAVRFPGVAGSATDSIVVDPARPVIRSVKARWVTARHGWVVTINAKDKGTGLAAVRVGKTKSAARSRRWPADIVSWDSSQLRWIQVVDRAGNASAWYRLRV